jgi:hypothetical protein
MSDITDLRSEIDGGDELLVNATYTTLRTYKANSAPYISFF